MPHKPLLETAIPGLTAIRGKVRDVYDLGDQILLIASDRISAFDWILSTGIPDKGRVLTQISLFWFELLAERLGVEHHLITADVKQMGLPAGADLESLDGRSMLCRKTRVIPFECVARGYLSGSAWIEYQQSAKVCGIPLPAGLVESSQLPEVIFTPATKAEQGKHDENVSFDRMVSDLGEPLSSMLRERTLELYQTGASAAADRGVLIADTKFEFGLVGDTTEPLLIDEVLTPDSSRFWRANAYQPGEPQPSFDKQYVRDWLLASGWDRESPPPELPEEVVERTRDKYVEAYEMLTGIQFE